MNTDKGDCSVQIGTKYWNFQSLFENHKVIKTTVKEWEYYISPRKPLAKDQIPEQCHHDIDLRAVAFNPTTKQCYNIAYSTDFDYNIENTSNLDQGLIYYADGQPAKEAENDYQLFDVAHSLRCDKSQTGDVEPTVTTHDTGSRHMIFIEWSHAEGCAQDRSDIPPEPPKDPDCKFQSILDNFTSSYMGIDVDFSTLNNGPVGIRSYFLYNGEKYLHYYTPCGHSIPPFNAKLADSGVKYSSSWVCNISNSAIDTCWTYGEEKEQPDYKLPTVETDGLVHTLEVHANGVDRQTQVKWECQQSYPAGYVEMPLIAEKFDATTLWLSVDNNDICLKEIPKPIPPSGEFCRITQSQYNSQGQEFKIDLNLQYMNKGKEGIVITDSTISPPLPPQKKTLMVQPCAGIKCPTSTTGNPYHCDGDEFATVWVCDPDTGALGSEFTCDAFGLFDPEVAPTATLIDGSVANGVKVTYKGSLHRSTELYITCNKSLLSNDLKIDPRAKQDGNVLKINAQSKNACYSGPDGAATPTPKPLAEPRIPKKGKTPTPTPNPRPDNDLFFENGTHFVYIDLERVTDETYNGEGTLVIRGDTNDVTTQYTPWRKTQCPAGNTCTDGPNTTANMWTCWKLNDIKRSTYCHNAGDIAMGVQLVDAGNGLAMLRYEGGYGTGVDIRLKCSIGHNITSLTNLEPFVTYHEGTQGAEFEYTTITELACWSKFVQPMIPKRITPKPDPIAYNKTWKSEKINETQYKINLNDIPSHDQIVYIGNSDTFSKVRIFFSAVKLTKCPKGYNCNKLTNATEAHSWLCFSDESNENVCFEAGDARYGLEYAINDPSDASKGFHVEYDGGLGNYETWLHFWCNTSVPAGEMYWHPVSKMFGSSYKIILETESRLGCPIGTKFPGTTTGGAVFLLIVFLGVFLYVFVMVAYNFFAKGEVAFPNAAFWAEFFNCVTAACVFIFTCGKGASIANSSYDKI